MNKFLKISSKIALGMLIILVGTELVLRLFGFGNVEVYVPDAELFWRLKPNQQCRTKIGRLPVSVNQYGFRNPSFEPSTRNGKRIFVFGDSATFGWGVRDDEPYARRVEELLKRDGNPVEVINAGVNGYSLFQERIAFRRSLEFSPDIAVFSYCFNESWHGLQTLSESGKQRVLTAVKWKNHLRNCALFHAFGEIQLRFLYDILRQKLTTESHGGKIEDADDRLARYRLALDGIASDANAAKVPIIFLLLPIRNATGLDPFQKEMFDFASKRNIPLVNVSLLGMKPEEFFLENDVVHPAPKGHEWIASCLEPTLVKLLGPSPHSVTAHH